MSNLLRTIIRFAIIVVFLILLVFLSITLFKIIPAGINQLATASLSITGLDKEATTTIEQNIPENRIPQPVATTTDGLNGIIQSTSDIIIKTPNTTSNNNSSRQNNRVIYYPINNNINNISSLKNIRVTLLSVGIIDRFTGNFVSTNSYNIDDTIIVKYQISNDQNTATGPFSMRVDMPAINSGDKTRFINNINIPARSSYNVEARFNGIDTSSNPTVNIYTDINNNVNETNESDNNLFVPINNINFNNNLNNNCYFNNCNINNFGQPNLVILSAQTGRFINGIFNPQNNFNIGDDISIQLRVRNNGGSFTNTWSTRTTYYDNNNSFRERVTNGERYLSAGEETTLTYNIPNINRGNTILNIQIDSNNNIFETNEGDNNTSLNIFMN